MQQYAITNVSSRQSLYGPINITERIPTDDIHVSVYILGLHNLFCNDNDDDNQYIDFLEIISSNR